MAIREPPICSEELDLASGERVTLAGDLLLEGHPFLPFPLVIICGPCRREDSQACGLLAHSEMQLANKTVRERRTCLGTKQLPPWNRA